MIQAISEYISASLDDIRTAVICFIMAELFVIYLANLVVAAIYWIKLYKIRKSKDLLENLLRFWRTRKLAREYKLGICFEDKLDDNKVKTTDLAGAFFNFGSILISGRINRQTMSSAAGMLVGLGVLGTFLGLSYSVAGFETTDSSKILKSIEQLLSGMGTAFFTSLAGMVLSSVYIFLEKIVLSGLSKESISIAEKLDEEYYISDSKKDLIISKDQQNAFIDAFSYKEFRDGVERVWKPGEVLREMYDFSSRQTAALEGLTEEFYENATSKAVKPLLDEIKVATDTLSSKIAELTKSVTERDGGIVDGVVNDLRSSIQEMVAELKRDIGAATSNKIDTLGYQIDTAAKTISMLPQTMQSMSESMKNDMQAMSSTLHETMGKVGENVSGMNAETAKIGEALLQKQSQVNANTEQMVESILGKISASVSGMNAETAKIGEEMLSKQSEVNNNMDQMIESFKTTVANTENLITSIKSTLGEFIRVQDATSRVTTNMENASTKVAESMSNLGNAQNSFIAEYKQSAAAATDAFNSIQISMKEGEAAIQQVYDASKHTVDNFNGLNNNTKVVFEKISSEMTEVLGQYLEGLEQFRKAVSDNTKAILSEYTDSVNKTIESLSGAIEQLDETLDDHNFITPKSR